MYYSADQGYCLGATSSLRCVYLVYYKSRHNKITHKQSVRVICIKCQKLYLNGDRIIMKTLLIIMCFSGLFFSIADSIEL